MSADVAVPAGAVEETIDQFASLDQAQDEAAMQSLAQRLGREQPAVLEHAAAARADAGDAAGEAAVFYATLVWAVFDRHLGDDLPRVTTDNLERAREEVERERTAAGDLAERPIHERTCPALVARQPHLYEKLTELVEEDVREDAMSADVAAATFPPIQVIVEAFDAAVSGRRPGLSRKPRVRQGPKVGRNEPCPCGSGKKHKRCCG